MLQPVVLWRALRRWPRGLTWLHHYTIASFALLLATGIMLYAPGIHTPLISYLPLAQALDPTVLLAWKLDGVSLPVEQGHQTETFFGSGGGLYGW